MKSEIDQFIIDGVKSSRGCNLLELQEILRRELKQRILNLIDSGKLTVGFDYIIKVQDDEK